MSSNVDNKKNTNWLQQLRLGNKAFDDSRNIFFKDKAVTIYIEKEKVVGVFGDEPLASILRPLFEQSIEVEHGWKNEKTSKEVLVEYMDGTIILKPGDDGYIDAVLIDKLQNELGMEVEL